MSSLGLTIIYFQKNKLLFMLLGLSAIILFLFYWYILKGLPNPQELKNYKVIPASSKIYDRNGKLLYEIFRDQNRTPIHLTDLPPYAKEATISIEDKDFYKHAGISIVGGMMRAARDMVFTHTLQGGSTLTQQLVKSALLSPERTIQRKLKEIVLAIWTEKIYTKDQILEMYLNQVPYGGSAYGIEEASEKYFGKHAKTLTLSEAAYLAGLPQAPSLYSPYANPDLAKNRQNEVIAKMIEYGYITKDQGVKALKAQIKIIPPANNIKAPHFVFYVKALLEQQYGADLVEEGGLQVYTTLDLDIQEHAEATVKDELEKIKNLHVTNGAALVTRPTTGEILAMVGSKDYFATASGTFNVTTALRQPGSSIKPINYAIGLDRKLVNPATVFLDIPTCFPSPGQPTYCPVNYDGQFHGPVQLRFALGNSFNIPAVKMLEINGVSNFVASSSAFLMTTFSDPSRYGLSLTLGGGEVRMTEMAQAFSTFANDGVPRKLVSVLKVEDKNGTVVYQFKDPNFVANIRNNLNYPNFLLIEGKRAISKAASFLISHILLDNNARMTEFGPSSALVVSGHQAVSVKTGTTDDKRDNWTIGYTPNFLVAVWVGNNDNSPMNPYLASGITGAAPIWNKITQYVLKGQPDLWPRKPDDIIGKQICSVGGNVSTKNPDGTDSCPTRFEYFIKGTENIPQPIYKTEKQSVPVNKTTGKLTLDNDPDKEMQDHIIIKSDNFFYCVDCKH